MSDIRRRNCSGCGRFLQAGDTDKCLDCDMECGNCHKRQSEQSGSFIITPTGTYCEAECAAIVPARGLRL